MNLYERVVLVRSRQHIINELIKKKKIIIPPHMAFGYEANAVAIHSILDKQENIILTHRNIAYNLAFDLNNFKKFLDEINLKKTGLNKGKNGSMNIVNLPKGIIYTSSILGNNLPIGLGVAITNKIIKKNKKITVIVTGDGAMEEGSFSETLIIAKKFNCLLLIIVENNDFAMASTINERRNPINIKNLAQAYNCNFYALSSRNVVEYSKKLKKIKHQIIKSSKPSIVEIHTSMFNRHAGVTPGWPSDPMVVSLEKGLIIKNNITDPVYIASKNINKNKINLILKNSKNFIDIY
jgi:TPP-dependent pyruvate/acetoin dehydrogenase alpha subunit